MGKPVATLPSIPYGQVPVSDTAALLPISLPTNVLGKAAENNISVCAPALLWVTQMALPAPGFSPVQP